MGTICVWPESDREKLRQNILKYHLFNNLFTVLILHIYSLILDYDKKKQCKVLEFQLKEYFDYVNFRSSKLFENTSFKNRQIFFWQKTN